MPLNCVFDSNFHDRLVLTTVAPIVIILGIVLTWLVLRYNLLLQGGDDVHTAVSFLTSKSIRLSVLVLFTVFPMVSTTIFQTFQYDYNLQDGSAYLIADYSINKNDPIHQGFVAYAVVMCLLYCFGIPAASWYTLYSRKDKIQTFMVISESLAAMEQECQLRDDADNHNDHNADNDDKTSKNQIATFQHRKTVLLQQQIVKDVMHQFVGNDDATGTKECLLAMKHAMEEQDPWLSGLSPLYKDYESEYWWFEIAKFISTLILCGPLTLIPVEGASQVFISMAVSMFMMSLFANCRPYIDFSNDILQQFCQVSLTFAMAVGLLERASESSRDVLFGPLLIICTCLNLGLGVAVVGFEFVATVATEMPATMKLKSLRSVHSTTLFSKKKNHQRLKTKCAAVVPGTPNRNVMDDSDVNVSASNTESRKPPRMFSMARKLSSL